jgi:hypothetical protein
VVKVQFILELDVEFTATVYEFVGYKLSIEFKAPTVVTAPCDQETPSVLVQILRVLLGEKPEAAQEMFTFE